MKKQFTLLLAALVLLASCSGNRFTSRKYTKGHYISHAQKPNMPARHAGEPANAEPQSSPAVLTASSSKKSIVVHAPKALPDQLSHKTSSKSKSSSKRSVVTGKTKKHDISHRYSPVVKKSSRKASPKSSGSGLEKHALRGFIFSVAALLFDVIGFIITVSVPTYAGLLIILPAIALGIIGLINGTKGLKEHKRNGGSTSDLVFSIMATAIGGASLILALIFSIDGALYVTAFNLADSAI